MKRLEDQELAATTGGVAWWIPVGAGAVIVTIMRDWDEFKQGLTEGWKTYDTP